jgi:hypothetical protein
VKQKFNDITHTVRWILIIAAAIVVAWILWTVVTFALSIAFKVVEIAVLAAILYVVYLVVRSAMRNRTT